MLIKEFYTNVNSTTEKDEFYTPLYAVIPIEKELKPNSRIWCPFDLGSSIFVRYFKSRGHTVINTHIWTGDDFFKTECPDCDYIISNPPWSKKDEILRRLFELKKPFAMLFGGVGMFDSKKRFDMFKENEFEIMYLSPRVAYFKNIEDNDTKNSPPFQSIYVCSGILDNKHQFEEVDKKLLKL